MKTCTKCKIPKSLDSFYKDRSRKDGLSWFCKECTAQNNANGYINYRDKRLEHQKEYSQTEIGKKVINKASKRYNETENGQIIRKKCNKIFVENGNYAKWIQEKFENDINYILKRSLRHRLNDALNGNSKSAHTLELLGCSLEFFLLYIESQFEIGMNWENVGKRGWHLDHYIPCASFDLSDPQEQQICFNYLNLRPLWREENLKKHAKVPSDARWWITNIKNNLHDK